MDMRGYDFCYNVIVVVIAYDEIIPARMLSLYLF